MIRHKHHHGPDWSGAGTPLGLFLAASVTRASPIRGVGFHLPLAQLVILTVIAGVLAALQYD
jgi:hypothetical protein